MLELSTLYTIMAIVLFWGAIFTVGFVITTGIKAMRIYALLGFIGGSIYVLILQPDPILVHITLFVVIFLLSSYGMGYFYGKIWIKR